MPKCQISRYDLVCRTCYQHLRENEISACPLTNSKGFPEKPPDFDLTSLEEHFVAPRIPIISFY